MRKFTKFFMLLFALVGATVGNAQTIAQSPTKISELTSGYYIIKNVNSRKPNAIYVYCENTTNGALKLTATTLTADVETPTIDKYLWYVDVKTSGENVTITISSVTKAGYWPTAQTGDKSLVVTNEPQVYDLKTKNQTLNGTTSEMTEDGNTCLIGNSTNYEKDGTQTYSYFHINGDNRLGSWHNTDRGSLLYAQFYSATGFTYNNVILNYTDSKLNNTFTKEAGFLSSSTPTLEELTGLDFYTIKSVKNASDETVTKITESGTYTVDCTSDFPFEVMTINGENFGNANFYTMQINSGRDMLYEEGTGITTVANTKGFNKKSLWAFELVSGTENEFKIYNFAAGTSSLLTVNGNGNGTTANMSSTSPGSTGAQQFKLAVNGTGWAFIHPQTTNVCLNTCKSLVNNGANTGLGLWSGLDGGACINFTSVDAMVPETNFYGGGSANPSYTTEDGYVTMPNTETINALYSYNNYKTASWLGAAIDKVAATEGFDLNDIYNLGTDAAKIYQIIAYADSNKDQPIYANPCQTATGEVSIEDRTLYTSATAPVAQTAMLLVKDGANYYIEHANSEYWFPNISHEQFQGTPDLPNQKGNSAPYTIHTVNWMTNVFGLKIASTDKWLVSGAADNKLTTVTEDPTTANKGAGNPAGFWLIKEIKSIPVTIGAAKWSTLCLPVAVTVPNDANLKVYTVSGVDNGTGVMTLNPVEAGTVVAKKTGLLLASTSENESDTYNFAVSTDAGTSYEGNNILMGTTARRKGFNTADGADPTAITIPHYALAQQDGVVAFYPSTLNILPANKAYIKKADIASSGSANRALYMTGNTTGVDSTLIQNGEAEEYYDLNGRRVLYPTTGIYATRSGKKVFIK